MVDSEFRGTLFSVIFAQQDVVQQNYRGPRAIVSSQRTQSRPVHQTPTVPTPFIYFAYESTPHLGLPHHDLIFVCPSFSSILKTYVHDTFCMGFPSHCSLLWNLTISTKLYQPTNGTLHRPSSPLRFLSFPGC